MGTEAASKRKLRLRLLPVKSTAKTASTAASRLQGTAKV